MQALIDGDIVVFRSGFAAERTVWHLAHGKDLGTLEVFDYKREATDRLDEVCPGVHSREEGVDYRLFPEVQLEPLSHALHNVKLCIERMLDTCQIDATECKIAFSPSSTFRHDLAKTRPYKGNRDKARRPTYEKEIRDYMKSKWDCYTGDNEEADDLLGIWATQYGHGGCVIMSLDKDLDQIPGYHYNWVHDISYVVTEEEAIKNFHLQLLTGDSTDNIVGLPGIGPGKANKALHGCETPAEQMDEVVRQYQIHSGKEDWEEYLREMGQLLWIRRVPGEMWEYAVTGEETDWGTEELTLHAD